MLGQFHLEFAFIGRGVLTEYVQNQGGAVNYLAAKGVFQVALLSGIEFVVEDDHITFEFVHHFANLIHLARTNIGGAKAVCMLGNAANNLCSGGVGQVFQFREGIFQRP